MSIRIEACPELRPKFPPHQRGADQRGGGNAIVHRMKCCGRKQKQPNRNKDSQTERKRAKQKTKTAKQKQLLQKQKQILAV